MGVKLRERQLESGKISLYLDIYHKGKRNYEFLDLHLGGNKKKNRETRRLAEAIRSKRELQLYNKQYDFEVNDEDLTLTDFIIHLKDNSNKTSSKNYGSVLHHLKAYHRKEKVRFDDLTSAWLEGFRAYLLSKVKKSTARTYFLIFRSLLNKAVAKGHIKVNPLNRHDVENIEKDPARIQYLTDDEVKKLWNTKIYNNEVRRAFLFSVYTGLRRSDIQALKWSDIQHITDEKKGVDYKQIELKQQKTSDFVHIPISKTAEPLLEVKVKGNDRVFNVNESIINYWLPKWKKKAKISKKIHFHMARHTFATKLLRRGVDIYTVKELMGHSSVSSTEKYLHLVSADKKNAIDKL